MNGRCQAREACACDFFFLADRKGLKRGEGGRERDETCHGVTSGWGGGVGGGFGGCARVALRVLGDAAGVCRRVMKAFFPSFGKYCSLADGKRSREGKGMMRKRERDESPLLARRVTAAMCIIV